MDKIQNAEEKYINDRIGVTNLKLGAVKKYAKKYLKNTIFDNWTATEKINKNNMDIIKRHLLKVRPDIFYNEINIRC